MALLLKKINRQNRIISINSKHANAMRDPIRLKIIKLLYNQSLSIEQLSKKLSVSGFKNSLSSIRHHVDLLKDSELIDIIKIQESRGTFIKFYTTTTKIFDFNMPDLNTEYIQTINIITKKLKKPLQNLLTNQLLINHLKTYSTILHDDYMHFIIFETINTLLITLFNDLQKK